MVAGHVVIVSLVDVFIMGIKERRKKEKEYRKQQILIAARHCFKRQGYQATSIKTIAGEAELSSGLIYLYYKSKEDLYAALLISILEQIYVRFLHIFYLDLSTIKDRLTEMTRVILDIYEDEPEMTIHLFHLLSQSQPSHISIENENKLVYLFTKTKEVSSKLFSNAADVPNDNFIDPITINDIFWSTCIGTMFNEKRKHYLMNTPIRLKPSMELNFDLFKKGLREMLVDTPNSQKYTIM